LGQREIAKSEVCSNLSRPLNFEAPKDQAWAR